MLNGKPGNMKIYKGRKVFVTGHTGFKGSWLIMMLHRFGAVIKGYALAPENTTDLYPSINGDALCQSVIADIRDLERLRKEILEFEPDFIFHLAAQPLVRYSYNNPVDTFEVNVIGTVNVLEAARPLKNKCSIVIVTTDKVYENPELNQAFREEDKLGGHDPYSSSKACAEIVTESYRRSFFNPTQYHVHQKSVASARAGNVIGGGDFAVDRIVPDIIRSLSAGSPVPVRNPNSIRPWQHVLDPLSGYLQLGAKIFEDPHAYSPSYNFGPDPEDDINVETLVKIAVSNWGNGKYEIFAQENALHEAKYLMLDNQKAKRELGWKPRMGGPEAIGRTIAWYKNDSLNGLNRKDLMISDIEYFFNE
jgi:CDP-glucose 4,6-dehydratase